MRILTLGARARATNAVVLPRLATPAALLLLAAGLRVAGLTHESLWTDEGASVYYAQSFGTAFQDANPPLYYLVLHVWIALFGTSEIALRLPSAIFGVATVWLAYRLTRELLNARAAVYAAGLLGLSTFQIFYSQEARAYALLALLAVASMYGLVRLVASSGGFRPTVTYTIASILLLYAHPYSVFLVASQWVVVVVAWFSHRFHREVMRDWLISQAVLVVAFAPWAISLLLRGRTSPGYTLPPVSVGMLKETLLEYANGIVLLGYVFVALVAVAIVLDSRSGMAFDRRQKKASALSALWVDGLLLSWALGTLVFAVAASLRGPSLYYPRYTIAAAVGLYILIAHALDLVRPGWVSLATAGVVGVLMAAGLPAYYSEIHKEQWREAAVIIDAQAAPGALVIFDGLPPSAVFDLYSQRADLDKELLPAADQAPGAISGWLGTRPDFWLLHLNAIGPLDAHATAGFEVVDSFPLFGLQLEHVQRSR